jgi:hypothetical protein
LFAALTQIRESGLSHGWRESWFAVLGKDLIDHFSVDVGQTVVSALEGECQAFVVDAQAMQ